MIFSNVQCVTDIYDPLVEWNECALNCSAPPSHRGIYLKVNCLNQDIKLSGVPPRALIIIAQSNYRATKA